MTHLLRNLALTAIAAGSIAAAHADDYITPYAGYFDVIRHKFPAAQFGAEYRFSDVWNGFRPTLGVNTTTDGLMAAYGGFNWDVPLIKNELYLIPNFMVNLVREGTTGRNLGGPIEFRSGIELDYQFLNTQRVGLAFNHISNADIYNHNPGAETLLVTYSIPLGTVAGWVR